jgi:hypothetical protein
MQQQSLSAVPWEDIGIGVNPINKADDPHGVRKLEKGGEVIPGGMPGL